ncbi:MAG: AAA family ATPase [Kangiellaceae bacterium]
MTQKELALRNLQEIARRFENIGTSVHSANEATTRLLIIDDVLRVLGWNSDEFNPESHTSTNGYIDYLLKYKNVPRLVVEAKKIGSTFSTPTSRKPTQHEYTVSYFKQAFKSLFTKTIKQAYSYCYDSSVTHAVITNGAEWIVLQLIPKPGKTVDSMKGVYFGNIFTDNFYFDLFYELLSKERVVSGNLESYLSEINYVPSPISKTIKSDFGNLQWRTYEKERYLDEFYRAFFDEITSSSQKKMLEHCFVSDSKLDQYSGDLKRILRDTPPNFLPFGTEDMEPGEGAASLIEEKGSGKVILITGSVGCGKTTLVKKVLNETKRFHKMTTVPILVDLINDVSRKVKHAKNIIFKRINESFINEFPEIHHLDSLKCTYRAELNALKNGANKNIFERNPEKYLEKEAELLERLIADNENFVIRSLKNKTNQKTSVILIIDNVDRASEDFQEETYIIAHKLSKESGVTVIITMREFTYFKNKENGWLDVRSGDRVIHLKAPDFSILVAKRVKYIEEHFDDDFRAKEWRRNYDYSEFKELSFKYASVVRHSLQEGKSGQRVLETLSCISWHNIRLFQDLLRQVHKQLGSALNGWKYEEVITALMVSQEDGQPSILPNLFIPYLNVNQAYYLKVRVLLFLNYSLKPSERTHGIPLNRILCFSQMYGYRGSWSIAVVEECVRQRLVECVETPTDGDDIVNFNIHDGETFRISPLGSIILQEILNNQTYLALLATELPFHDLESYENVKTEYEEVLSYMGDMTKHEILKDGIDLLSKSQLPKELSRYLSAQYKLENIATTGACVIPDIRLTEDKLQSFIHLMKSHQKTVTPKIDNPSQYTLKLSEDPDFISASPVRTEKTTLVDQELVEEILPANLNNLKINNSEYIPLILCALVVRKFMRFEGSSGVELTQIINNYLVGESNRKESTNVSRSLRSPRFKSLPWLLIREDLHPKFKSFSLNDNWPDFWREYFNEEPKI